MTAPLTDLLTESRQLGFLGPGPVDGHICHAAAFAAAAVEVPARALDLGAGGGLPGLVLAATVWPQASWCFLDAHERRTDFLRRAVQRLGLADRVQVQTARVEEHASLPGVRGTFDLVVARSFSTPAVTAECAAPLLRAGGFLLASEPPTAQGDGRWPSEGLSRVGFAPAEAVVVDSGNGPVHLVRICLVTPADRRFPRRTGVPAKRPLF